MDKKVCIIGHGLPKLSDLIREKGIDIMEVAEEMKYDEENMTDKEFREKYGMAKRGTLCD